MPSLPPNRRRRIGPALVVVIAAELVLAGTLWFAWSAPEREAGPFVIASTPIDPRDGATTVLAPVARLDAIHNLVVRWPHALEGTDDRSVALDWRVDAQGLHIDGQATVPAHLAPAAPFPGTPIGAYGISAGTPCEVAVIVRDIANADLGGGPVLEVVVNPASWSAARDRTSAWSVPVTLVATALMLVLLFGAGVGVLLLERRRRWREHTGACVACGHPLAGGDRCPECGVERGEVASSRAPQR
ncbi:MAG: hypothetical protein KDA22_11445 [Phycisphaerales bacterium]|nr:hypothetical protein [Phycisphaerales bacterium]